MGLILLTISWDMMRSHSLLPQPLCEPFSQVCHWPCSCPGGTPPSLHLLSLCSQPGQPFSSHFLTVLQSREGSHLSHSSLPVWPLRTQSLCAGPLLSDIRMFSLFHFYFSELIQSAMSSYLKRLSLRSLASQVMSTRGMLDNILLQC